jgi:hypothetical protein
MTKFFRIIFLAVLCLSLAGKALAQDSCDNSKSSQNKSVISYDNSGDLADSSDCKDCICHCHHSHFDFASLAKSFAVEPVAIDNFHFDLASSSPLQNTSPKKPPKIVS